jgi:hypothetical protein
MERNNDDEDYSLSTLQRWGAEMEQDRRRGIDLAEKLLRIRTRDGALKPLIANPAQLRFEQRRGRQNIVLKARQMGLTTWIAGRFFLRTITTPGTLTLLVAHTRESTESIFRAVQRMWEELDEEFRKGVLARSRANVGQMVFKQIDSEFRVASASDCNPGRGLSLQNLHCTEVSRWPGDAAETLAGLRAALAPTGELALESTPHGAYGAFYNEWHAGLDSNTDSNINGGLAGEPPSVGLVKHFLPWWMEPAYVAAPVDEIDLTGEERLLRKRHSLSAEQIGYRRGLQRSYGVLRSQEFAEDAETCFRATGACCFDVEAIEQRIAELVPPIETRRNGALQIWWRSEPGHDYLVAVDTAGGGSAGDFAVVQVIELSTGVQCAELQERLNPPRLAAAAAQLAAEYGGATIAVERNNHGGTVLAYLKTGEKYERLWRARGASEDGWLTTAASKYDMVARMGLVLQQTPECFKSRRLLGECRTFVNGERGSSGAANGEYDDLVMAMAVAQSVRKEMLKL